MLFRSFNKITNVKSLCAGRVPWWPHPCFLTALVGGKRPRGGKATAGEEAEVHSVLRPAGAPQLMSPPATHPLLHKPLPCAGNTHEASTPSSGLVHSQASPPPRPPPIAPVLPPPLCPVPPPAPPLPVTAQGLAPRELLSGEKAVFLCICSCSASSACCGSRALLCAGRETRPRLPQLTFGRGHR